MSVPAIQTGDLPVLDKSEKEGQFTDAKTPQHTYSSDQSTSGDEGYDSKNPFLNPDIAAHWRQVYEASSYECRHKFDPNLTWTEEEEKKLIRKLDWRVCLWAVRNLHYTH